MNKLFVFFFVIISLFCLSSIASFNSIFAQQDTPCGRFEGDNFPTELICRTDLYCGINTALGCFPIGRNGGDATVDAAKFIYLIAIGLGSGISLLLIIYSGITIITSAGNPQKLDAGKQLLTAAIAGLVLIILSVTILRIIGADILEIPNF